MTQPAWGSEPGLAQVVCGCLCETFTFVISDVAVRMVCSSCGQVNGELTRPPGWQPFTSPAALDDAFGWKDQAPHVTGPPRPPQPGVSWVSELPAGHPAAGRDMLWVPEPLEMTPDFEPVLGQGGPPQASPDAANVVLAGGPYDGWLLALPADVTAASIASYTYADTGRRDDAGRRILVWQHGLYPPELG